MDYKEYFTQIKAEYTKNLIDEEVCNAIETELKFKFGPELREYILNYGYLAFGSIEYYGINSKQGAESDMVKQTKYLHQYFEKTSGFIALGNIIEGKYALISADDSVFEYDTELDLLVNTEKKLFDYIKASFESKING